MKNTLKYMTLAAFLGVSASPAGAGVTWPKQKPRAQDGEGKVCLLRSEQHAKKLGEFVAEVKRQGSNEVREIPYNAYTQGDCLKAGSVHKGETLVFRGHANEVIHQRKLNP